MRLRQWLHTLQLADCPPDNNHDDDGYDDDDGGNDDDDEGRVMMTMILSMRRSESEFIYILCGLGIALNLWSEKRLFVDFVPESLPILRFGISDAEFLWFGLGLTPTQSIVCDWSLRSCDSCSDIAINNFGRQKIWRILAKLLAGYISFNYSIINYIQMAKYSGWKWGRLKIFCWTFLWWL